MGDTTSIADDVARAREEKNGGETSARGEDDGMASRSRTMIGALGRLAGRTLEANARATEALRVVVLGADRREGTNPKATARAFDEMRVVALERGVERVSVLCVGPNVVVDDEVTLGVKHEVEGMVNEQFMGKIGSALDVEYRTGLYHDSERGAGETADVAFAFNAGVWGYAPSDWAPTIARVVVEERAPLIVTSYTLFEAESDEDAMRASLSAFENIEWVWEAEINPSRSTAERELEFDRADYISSDKDSSLEENSAWQCVAVSNVV